MSHPLAGKKVLITGGLGLIGSNLAHALVDLGVRVTLLDANLPTYGGNLFNLEGVRDRVKLEIADIRDQKIMERLIADNEIIYSLAGQVSYLDSNLNPIDDLDINCRGHLIILEACRRLNPSARLVFPSSRMVYGRIKSNPVREDHPTEPLSIYGVHKLAGEKYYAFYHQNHGLATVSVRLANPYGVRSQMVHSRYSIVNWFIRQALDGQDVTIYGDGAQVRDYVYIGDMIDALIACGYKSEAVGRVFNLGSGKGTPFKEMAEQVVRAAGTGRVVSVAWPDNYERIETGGYYLDIGLAQKLLDWTPGHDLAAGIAETVDYYRRHRKHYW